MHMKTFVLSQFSYCPQIWMFHCIKMKHMINSIHKRVLKLVYQDSYDLTFQELQAKDKSGNVHQKNLQLLATDIFKSKTGVSPELMNDIFHFVEMNDIFHFVEMNDIFHFVEIIDLTFCGDE